MNAGDLDRELAASVCARVAELLSRDHDAITVDAQLRDLAIDSIDLIEVAIDLQEEYEVWFDETDLAEIDTIGDLVGLIGRRRSELAPA